MMRLKISFLVAFVMAINFMDTAAALATEVSDNESQCMAGFKDWKDGRYHLSYGGYGDARLIAASEIMRSCEAAEQSNPENSSIASQLCLGYFVLKQNYRAMPFCLSGLKGNRHLSATVLGAIYMTDRYRAPRGYRDRAVFWLQQASDGGAGWTMRLMGQALEQEDPIEAVKWFEGAAKQGDPEALLGVARLRPVGLRLSALEDALAAAKGQNSFDRDYIRCIVAEAGRLALADSPEIAADFYDRNKEDLGRFNIDGANYSQVFGWAVAINMTEHGLHDAAIDRMRVMIEEFEDMPSIVSSDLRSIFRRLFSKSARIDSYSALMYGDVYLDALEKFRSQYTQPKIDACALIMSRYKSVGDSLKRRCLDI